MHPLKRLLTTYIRARRLYYLGLICRQNSMPDAHLRQSECGAFCLAFIESEWTAYEWPGANCHGWLTPILASAVLAYFWLTLFLAHLAFLAHEFLKHTLYIYLSFRPGCDVRCSGAVIAKPASAFICRPINIFCRPNQCPPYHQRRNCKKYR